ncbi:hypothetical protein GCM10027043_11850 [Ferruginibacter profundus]
MSLYAAKGQGKYYPKAQWYTSSHKLFQVKAKPKKVTEFFYNGVDSLTGTDLKKIGSYDEFIYDTAGNLLSRKLFFDDNFWNQFTTNFSSTGLVSAFQSKSKAGIENGILMKIAPAGDGRYKQIIYRNNKPGQVIFYTFKNKGDDILLVEQKKIGDHTTTNISNLHYNGNQLLSDSVKVVTGKDTYSTQKKYFYGKDNSLDSVITYSGKERKRLLFIKNEHGDPLAEIEIEHNDTTEYKTYIYLYDAKGNWIRRVEEDRLSFGQTVFQNQKFSMIRREIIY